MCIGMASERAGSFVETRKRFAREKALEVIDVKPLTSLDSKSKK